MPTVDRSVHEELDQQGFTLLEDVIDPARDLAPILAEYEAVLDRVAEELHQSGAISERYAHLPFGQRLIHITKESGRSLSQFFDISLPQGGVQIDTPIHCGPACFNLLTNSRLLDAVEPLVGEDIYVSPVGHVRMKLPEGTLENGDGLMAKIPWHQDNGVVLEEADHSNVLTVWIPINDATVENGCLRVLPTPRAADLATHCPSISRGAHIPDTSIDQDRAVTLPMRAGSVLLMHPRTPHCSLENTTTDQVRISMDLRYQPVGQPTGRPQFPGFVARSRTNPSDVLDSQRGWERMWHDARARLAADPPEAFNRWDANAPVCA